MSKENADLSAVAGLANFLNSAGAEANSRMDKPSQEELYKPVRVAPSGNTGGSPVLPPNLPTGAAVPQHPQISGVPQNVPATGLVQDDGLDFDDITPEMMAEAAGGGVGMNPLPPRPQPRTAHPMAAQGVPMNPVAQPTPTQTGLVFPPDMQGVILRKLVSIETMLQKIIERDKKKSS